MDLPRAFVPEARRLLKLARTDRRAAERELASLTPEEQATVVLEAPLSIRRQTLELLPEPEAVVPLLPEAELCYTCRAIGLEDAAWLLPMATDEQLVAKREAIAAQETQVADVQTRMDALQQQAEALSGQLEAKQQERLQLQGVSS